MATTIAPVNERRIHAVAFVLFTLAAGLTVYFAQSMSGGMSMPGGWTMSMMWMRMPGQAWLEPAGVFLGMWVAMMVAMMLPSTLPMLLLYRRTMIFRGEAHPEQLMWTAAAGYFGVWTLFGATVYLFGVGLSELAMASSWTSRAMPALSGSALIVAGVYQLTPWKASCLHHCRDPLSALAHLRQRHPRHERAGAFTLGFQHGAFCAACCWGLMVIQLTLGIMSLTAMILVAAVIAFEKLIARGPLVARVVGVAAILAGLGVIFLTVRT